MSNFQSLCQNAVKDDASLSQFINQQFSSFFSQFNAFLIQFQFPNSTKHQYQGSYKRKKLINIFDDVLSNVKTIISKTQKNNYSPQLKIEIKDVFTCLLHPMTPDKIRQSSIPIFYTLIEKLGDHAFEMLQDVSRFVFDFSIIRDECSKESNLDNIVDQKKCISIPGMEMTDKEQLVKNIEEFEKLMIKSQEPEYSHLFPFFKRMMLIPAYDRAINKKSVLGISGVVPEILHKTIISILNHATKFTTTFKAVVKESMGYFVEAAIQASSDYSTSKKSRVYVLRFYETLCDDQNNDILKAQPINLISRGLESLLDLIQSSVNIKCDDIIICYERTLKYFQLCLSLFASERKTLALQLINWPHPESLPQILIILLTGFVNVEIEDSEIWDLLKQPNKYSNIFLATLSVFSSYFALSISESLLKFTIENASHAIIISEPHANWIGKDNNPLMKGFVSEKVQLFFMKNKKSFCLQENIPYLYPIEGKVWKPLVETIKNMNYESVQDPEMQYKTYLPGASFVYPLVMLITNFPLSLDYNVSFVIENFFDWLKECCSPSKTNANIISTSLRILGLIFSNDYCVHSLSNESIVDWVLTIQHYLKSTNQQIKIMALKLGCKAIYNGILGSSSILNDDIAANLLTFNKKSIFKIQLSTINSVELIDNIDSQYRASYLFRILMESVYNSKSDNLEPIVTAIIALLKQNARVTDIYSLWPMILFIKEMRALNGEAVDRLIIELANLFEKIDQAYGEILLQFLCDLIIYSSSTKGMDKFVELPEEYKQSYVLLYLSQYFNNLTYPSYETNKLDKQFFTNGRHEILQFYDKNKISTNLAVGHFTFQFKQHQEIDMDETTVLDPNSFSNDTLTFPYPTDYEFQTNLNNSATNFFKEGLFTPSDFSIQNDNSNSNDTKQDFPENYSQKFVELPKNYGPQAASFASSAGFNDPISSYRLVPCGFPTFNADLNIQYKKKIEIGVRVKAVTANFKRFQSGLGIIDSSNENSILYKDCRNEISFIINSTIKANKIEVFWNDKSPNSFIPKTLARIQITEMDDNFLVETLFNKEVASPNGLCDAVVSMKSLPAFIIAQVLNVHKIIKSKKSLDKYLLAANKLKTVEEENFPQRSQMFSNEKSLINV